MRTQVFGCKTSSASVGNNLEHSVQSGGIGLLGCRASQGRLVFQTLAQDHLGRETFQSTLSTAIAGDVEARRQDLQILMTSFGDAEHLALHPIGEALDHAFGFRGVGSRLAVRDLVAPASNDGANAGMSPTRRAGWSGRQYLLAGTLPASPSYPLRELTTSAARPNGKFELTVLPRSWYRSRPAGFMSVQQRGGTLVIVGNLPRNRHAPDGNAS